MEERYIDKTLIFFKGKLIMYQYIKGKHKYEIKLFKLYTSYDYTYNLKFYAKNTFFDYSQNIATQTVL